MSAPSWYIFSAVILPLSGALKPLKSPSGVRYLTSILMSDFTDLAPASNPAWNFLIRSFSTPPTNPRWFDLVFSAAATPAR